MDESLNLYNISEYLLHQFIYVVSGVKIKYADELKKIILIPIEENLEKYVDWAREEIKKEFSIPVEIDTEIKKELQVPRRTFLVVRRFLRKLKSYNSEKETGIILITRKRILLNDRIWLRLVYSVFPILGVAYINPGVCAVTTFSDQMPQNVFNHTVSHEIAHLLGMHGYPVSK